LGNDGNFYGTTYEGGVYGEGSIFKVTTNGTLTTLVSFSGSDASKAYAVFPRAALTLGNDGNFYGTTMFGGSIYDVDDGTIFEMIPNVALIILASFDGSNGTEPELPLTMGADGNFYGTTDYGGSNDFGAIFQATRGGALTTLASLSSGTYPSALTLGNDGNLYGTTEHGGIAGYGTVFQVTANGTLTTAASFFYTNGDSPSGLTLGNDGKFYGTTEYGGIAGYGTIFQVKTNGTLTTLVSFEGTNGANPEAALTLGNDGNFYGTTYIGGSAGYGTVFRLLMTPTFSVQPQSQTNNAGATVAFTCETILQPVGLQWQKNGANLTNGGNISGATGSTLTITDISDSDVASYSVIASNPSGSVSSSSATLAVIDAPSIAVQPTNELVLLGTSVAFGVTMTGTPPFSYQWQFNNADVLDATNASYAIPSVGTNNAGDYSVVVSNQAGSVTSSNATLTVNYSLLFATQPFSQTVAAGTSVTFTATADGVPPFVFQWSFNQTPVGPPTAGTNFSSFTLTNVGTNQAGNYTVQVFNGSGSLTSSNAVLTVIQPPALGLQILAGYPVLSLSGTLGNEYVVQYNTNLAGTNWTYLLSLSDLSASPYQFLDPSGVGQPARFYRALTFELIVLTNHVHYTNGVLNP
jgi:uncharacterized repeat protein (TIGR03803 family)